MRSVFRSDRAAGAARFMSLIVVAAGSFAQANPASSSGSGVRRMTLAEARPVIAALGERTPAELRRPGADRERAWNDWMDQTDAATRARIARGDEDSVVNLMLYGTAFTRHRRATADVDGPLADVMDGRLDDLARAIEAPGGNPRIAFARGVIERQGFAVGPQSRESVRRYLAGLRSRVFADNERYARRSAAAGTAGEVQATLYRDRGLSTDTSLRVDFALEQALAALRDRHALSGRVERAAVVGPGLDFIDKAQGYDFHPVQMIQPFALADSLMRTGLAERPAIAALDLSARVLDHLRGARSRARQGEAYRWNLVLDRNPATLEVDPELEAYWRRAGDRLGVEASVEVPATLHGVRARAVDVRPEVVLGVEGIDANIVIDRTTEAGRPFDLVVATNVLVYYEPFEQALAATNIAGMLRDGGLLMTNQPVPAADACGLSPVLIVGVAFDRIQSGNGSHQRGDSIHVYRKR